MIRIIADSNIPFLKGVLEPYCDISYLPGELINRDVIRKADGLIVRTRTICDEALLSGSNIQFIASATIGYDHIDTNYCESRNINWANAPGCNSGSVAQYIATALSFLISKYKLEPSKLTIGIIGVGHIGKKVAGVATAFGMDILLNDPPRARLESEEKFSGLDQVLQGSDIITIHAPLNTGGIDNTLHLADTALFDQLDHPVFFLNTARGAVVDTNAMKNAIHNKIVTDAVIDVWENEPGIDPEFLALTALGTPHIAGYSLDGKANGTAMCVRSLSRHFGWGLDHWYPENIDVPAKKIIEIDNRGLSPSETLIRAIRQTYSIENESNNLKSRPLDFEKQRNNYPSRREFPVYDVRLKLDCGETYAKLEALGFNT